MCYDEPFRFAVGWPYKIYAIRIVGGRDPCLVAVDDGFFDQLSQGIVNADLAEVIACNAHESIGWNGGEAEGIALFFNAIRGLIIKLDGVDAKVGVDENRAVNILLAFDGRRSKHLEFNGFHDGNDEACVGNVVAFIKELDDEVLGPATVDDQFFWGVVGDGYWLTVGRAAMEVEVNPAGADDDLVFPEALRIEAETQQECCK